MSDTIDIGSMDSKALAELAKKIAAAATAKKRTERKAINLPKVETALDMTGVQPMVTIKFPLFEGPSVPNGYGKLLIASSANGSARYIAIGALADGRVVEVSWSARVPELDK
jgi:hypothetical protein